MSGLPLFSADAIVWNVIAGNLVFINSTYVELHTDMGRQYTTEHQEIQHSFIH